MPCGDFLWMKDIIKDNEIYYLGIDIVDELIDNNKVNYQCKNINFKACDVVNFRPNNQFDLVIIRDLFIHIKNIDIINIIENLKLMNIKYIAMNSYTNKENIDVTIGQHRKVNLLRDPFNLKEPIYKFKDYENDKFIFLYNLENLI